MDYIDHILETHDRHIRNKGIRSARNFLYAFYGDDKAFEIEKEWFKRRILRPNGA